MIDVDLHPDVPDGVKHLAGVLKDGIISRTLDPFFCRMVDQNGVLRSDGSKRFTPKELMDMDWLLDNIDGRIPEFDELLPVSQQLVRLLGLYRNSIQPKPEEVIL